MLCLSGFELYSRWVPLTQLIELNSTLARQLVRSATFETKSCYCRVARQALPCYVAVARVGFKRRATAVPSRFINYKYTRIYLKAC